MDIFRIRGSEQHQYLIPRDAHPAPPLRLPFEVELITSQNGQELQPTDFPWLAAHIPAYSARAVSALRSILESHGELFPLKGDGDYYALEVKVELDALDPEHSELILFPSTGRVMEIRRHVFRPEMIGVRDMFSIPELAPASWIYVSSKYIEHAQQEPLRGSAFEKVWSGDTSANLRREPA